MHNIIGHGTLIYADGDKYVGEWKDGKKSGFGELWYTNGDKFSGHWLDDKATGSGRLEYSNGDVYDGQWERDQRSGESCMMLSTYELLINEIHIKVGANSLLLLQIKYMKDTGKTE